MKNATSIYIRQRVTGLLLIPLAIWFSFIVRHLFLITSDHSDVIRDILDSPSQLTAFVLFASFGLYHGYLGLSNIIDDYVHCKVGNKVMRTMLFLFSVITLVAFITLLLRAHISS